MKLALKRDFEEFYYKHLNKVYRFVFFRVGNNKEVAEDLVSEIFMKVLEHFADFNPAISQSAWVMTIAKNHLKNYWRDIKATQPLPSDALEEDNFELSDAIWLKSAINEWRTRQDKAEAMELLAKLDSDLEQMIVTFHYILGYSYREIADLRGLSPGAVKVAAHRAIKKLRNLI